MNLRPALLANVNQTTVVFATLGLAYVFFVTVRGDLGKWLGLVGLAGWGNKAGSTASTGKTGSTALTLPALPALSGL